MKTDPRFALVTLVAVGSTVFAGAQTTGVLEAKPQAVTQTTSLPALSGKKPLLRSPGLQELGAALAEHPLTIDDVVAIALATNRSFASSLANLEAVRGQTAEAKTRFRPMAMADAQLTQFDKEIAANFGGASLVLTNQFNPIYSASITLPIDLFGAIRSSVNQAQFREVAARIDVNRVRNDTIFAVRNAFYNALRAQGQLVVAQDNLTEAQTRLHDARSILRVGIGTKFDVLTAQRDVADADQGVVQWRGQVTMALAQLKNVMGIDVSAPIRITDTGAVEEPTGGSLNPDAEVTSEVNTLPTTADNAPGFHTAQNEVPLGPDYAAAVKEALESRPEVLESSAAVAAARQGIQYARRSMLPSLSLSANYVVQPNNAGFTPEHQASIGLGFVVPIYDGGMAAAGVQQAKASVSSAEIQHRTAVDQVTLDVQLAYVSLVQARERVLVANVGITRAREAFRMARLRASAGVTSTAEASPELELSNAQTTLTQAETNRVSALYDYNIARSQLQRAMGRYSYGEGAGYAAAPKSIP